MSPQSGKSINVLKDLAVASYVRTLSIILTSVHEFASSRSAYPTEVTLHPFQPGDHILLKAWREEGPEHQLPARWTGPHVVIIYHASVCWVRWSKAIDSSQEG